MGNIFAHKSLPAPGDGLPQRPALISENQREAVQLPGKHRRAAANERHQIFHRFGLCGGQHGPGVADFRKALQQFPGRLLRRGAPQDNAGVPFQLKQLVIELVVFAVRQNRRVQLIIGGICIQNFGDQFFHSRYGIHSQPPFNSVFCRTLSWGILSPPHENRGALWRPSWMCPRKRGPYIIKKRPKAQLPLNAL